MLNQTDETQGTTNEISKDSRSFRYDSWIDWNARNLLSRDRRELITVTSCGIQKIYYQFVGKLNIAFLYSMGTFIHHYEKTSSFLEKVKTNQLIDNEQVNWLALSLNASFFLWLKEVKCRSLSADEVTSVYVYLYICIYAAYISWAYMYA